MKTTLTIVLVVVCVILVGAILLMMPKKGGIGMGIGGASSMSGSNEYGSKKTMEGKLKKIAIVASILFVGISLFLPFVD